MIHGVVHDEKARYFGGNTGHAGLFSTARDIALFSQTLLNGGIYGWKRIYRDETVDLFTQTLQENGELLDKILGNLPKIHSDVLSSFAIEELTYKEIAKKLGLIEFPSESVVKKSIPPSTMTTTSSGWYNLKFVES